MYFIIHSLVLLVELFNYVSIVRSGLWWWTTSRYCVASPLQSCISAKHQDVRKMTGESGVGELPGSVDDISVTSSPEIITKEVRQQS